jgi:excisionase family DNA binding protein
MPDVLLNIDEAAKQLQVSKEQIAEMVKKGLLRGFLDQKTYKFRPADIEAFKKKLASGATTLSEGVPKAEALPSAAQGRGEATSKIDLTELGSDAGIEETDQTSVLAPVRPGVPKEKQPEQPVFKFGEKDLFSDEVSRGQVASKAPSQIEQKPAPASPGSSSSTDKVVADILGPAPDESSSSEEVLEADQEIATKGVVSKEPAAFEEGDQTSLLLPGPGKAEKGKPEVKPAFDFAEKDLKLPSEGEKGDSVLIADESESSMDILEVAEESSSESGSSASRIMFSDEFTSGDEIQVASEAPAQIEQKPAPLSPGTGSSTDKIVADILGPAPDESSSDEALETLDVDQALETQEAVGVEAGTKPPTAAEPAADERETVGLPAAEETKVAEETKAAAGTEETKAALGEEVETGGVDVAVTAALREQVGEEAPEEAAPTIIPAGWETAESWPLGNGLLIAATVVLIIAGALLFCEAFNVHNGFTAKIAEAMYGPPR